LGGHVHDFPVGRVGTGARGSGDHRPSQQHGGITADQAADIYLGKSGVFPNGQRVTPVDQVPSSPARQKFYTKRW
jgi:hypothetical protein